MKLTSNPSSSRYPGMMMFSQDETGTGSPAPEPTQPTAAEVTDKAEETVKTAVAHEATAPPPQPAPQPPTPPTPIGASLTGLKYNGRLLGKTATAAIALFIIALLVGFTVFLTNRYDIRGPRVVIEPPVVEAEQHKAGTGPSVVIVKPTEAVGTTPQPPPPKVEGTALVKTQLIEIPILNRSDMRFPLESWLKGWAIRRGNLSGYARIEVTPNADPSKPADTKIVYLRVIRKIDDGKTLETYDKGTDGAFYRVPPVPPTL